VTVTSLAGSTPTTVPPPTNDTVYYTGDMYPAPAVSIDILSNKIKYNYGMTIDPANIPTTAAVLFSVNVTDSVAYPPHFPALVFFTSTEGDLHPMQLSHTQLYYQMVMPKIFLLVILLLLTSQYIVSGPAWLLVRR
jgi:hypothetical protein